MSVRQPIEATIAGLRVTSTPLSFSASQPLIADVAEFMSVAAKELGPVMTSGAIKVTDDLGDPKVMAALAPVLGGVAKFFGAGRLEKLAPKVMATTVVVMQSPRGELENYELGKEKDRNLVFDEHPEAYFPILFFAGRVTFQRFFPASVPLAGETPGG
jgi:hypothetical protein